MHARVGIPSWLRHFRGDPSSYLLVRALFLRLLGLVYGLAFISLWVQVEGLVGSNGILPVAQFLAAVHERLGTGAWYRLPTLCWLNSSDAMLHLLCGGGTLLALGGGPGAGAGRSVAILPVAGGGLSGFPLISVGYPVAGDRVSGDLLGSATVEKTAGLGRVALSADPVAAALAAVPPDVFLLLFFFLLFFAFVFSTILSFYLV